MNKYKTSRITASRVRIGMVLFHGGEVENVRRVPNGIAITANGRTWLEPADRRLTIYPNL